MKKIIGISIVLIVLLMAVLFVSGCTSPTPTATPKVAKIIGVQSGTTGEATAKEVVGAANETRVKAYSTITEVYPALLSGQVDAIVNDYPTTYADAQSAEYKGKFKFVADLWPTKEPIAIVINKENTNLTRAFNWALAALVADGTYDTLLAKYDLPKVQIALVTNKTNVTANQSFTYTTLTPGVLKVATEPHWRPFEMLNTSESDAQKKFYGFDMDLMRAIAAKLNTTVEFVDAPFDGIVTAVQAKQYDAGISSFSITSKRQEQVDFSDPYYQVQQAIMVRANDNSINGWNDLK